jgi:hypothetical protein
VSRTIFVVMRILKKASLASPIHVMRTVKTVNIVTPVHVMGIATTPSLATPISWNGNREDGERCDAHSWALSAAGGLGPCFSMGFQAFKTKLSLFYRVLSCSFTSILIMPIVPAGGPLNGPDNPP